MKLTRAAKHTDFTPKWYLVDAEGKVLGKLATQIADTLRGKNKPCFSPHVECGDHVIIINAEKIVLTGTKIDKKLYRTHSGYLGNMKESTAKEVLDKKPTRILEEAIFGMLPKNKLRNRFMEKLHIYAGPEHKHAGQTPEPFNS